MLCDVARTMFSEVFVNEMFRPQDVYSDSSMREVFDKLAHSSIMRLNQTSMDKLYDLMTMGVKFQIMQCRGPEEILDVTRNHLRLVSDIARGADSSPLISACASRFEAIFSSLSTWELWELKAAVLRFFQDRRVKVSLLLQDLVQNLDGTPVIDIKGALPVHVRPPGRVRYMPGASVSAAEVDMADAVALGCEGTVRPNTGTCPFGLNMYAVDRRSRKDAEAETDDSKPKPWPGPNSSTAIGPAFRGVPHHLRPRAADSTKSSNAAGAAARSTADDSAPTACSPLARTLARADERDPAGSSLSGSRATPVEAGPGRLSAQAASAGLTMLGSLIGARAGASEGPGGSMLSLNLFPDLGRAGATGAADGSLFGADDEDHGPLVVVEAPRSGTMLDSLLRDMFPSAAPTPATANVGAGADPTAPAPVPEADDLLSLMDSLGDA